MFSDLKNRMKPVLLWITLFLLLAVATSATDQCPSQCKCSKENTVVICKGIGLTSVPTGIPKSAEKIDLSQNSIREIGDKAFDGLQSLQKIDLRQNSIGKLSGQAFAGLTHLKTLYLSHNHLNDDTDLTSINGLSNINDLYLSFNFLTIIPAIQSESLKNLILDGNKIASANFPKSFQHCTNLASVILSNNQIGVIASTDFNAIQALSVKSIILKENSINSIDPAAFSTVANTLETLNMDNNLLNENDVKLMLSGFNQGVPKLLTLSLNRNRIAAIQSDLFTSLSNGVLRNLQLDFNLFHSIDSSALKPVASNLQLLSLRACGLKKFPFDLLSLQSLKQLTLNENKMTSIPLGLPQSLQQLKLSKNQISSWPDATFAGMDSLKVLDLSNNEIIVAGNEKKDTNLLSISSTIESLNLKSNPLTCTCDQKWLIKWAKENPSKLVDWKKYRCASPPNLVNTFLKDFNVDDCDGTTDADDESDPSDRSHMHHHSHHGADKPSPKKGHSHRKPKKAHTQHPTEKGHSHHKPKHTPGKKKHHHKHGQKKTEL